MVRGADRVDRSAFSDTDIAVLQETEIHGAEAV